MRAGIAVTPIGLEQASGFSGAIWTQLPRVCLGQSRSLRCPHYLEAEGGRWRAIWKHRASVCATWHCKYVRGTVGHEFGKHCKKLLFTIEKSLTRWCVLELNIGFRGA
jgi:hypothetical protein